MVLQFQIFRYNQLCMGFSCVVHHGLMGLRLCISTIGISTTFCNEPKNYPPKRCMSTVCYNNNTHAMLKVNASLESPMQGLHSESLWTGMLSGARLHIPAGILRIPVFSVLVALFPQESRFLFRRNLFFTPSEILSVWGQRRMLRRK